MPSPFAPGRYTLLSILVEGEEVLQPYASRDLSADLEYIPQSDSMDRNWNGGIIDFSLPQFRKFQMNISCEDFESNGLSKYPPGTPCIVHCLPQLGVNVDGDDSQAHLTLSMVMGRWKETRKEYSARTSWSLPLFEA